MQGLATRSHNAAYFFALSRRIVLVVTASLSFAIFALGRREILLAAVVVVLCCAPPRVVGQYYHVGIFQGVALPQRGLDVHTPSFNWMPALTVHFIPKKNPIVLGGSISLQFFDRTDEGKLGESMELLALPVSSICCFPNLRFVRITG